MYVSLVVCVCMLVRCLKVCKKATRYKGAGWLKIPYTVTKCAAEEQCVAANKKCEASIKAQQQQADDKLADFLNDYAPTSSPRHQLDEPTFKIARAEKIGMLVLHCSESPYLSLEPPCHEEHC